MTILTPVSTEANHDIERETTVQPTNQEFKMPSIFAPPPPTGHPSSPPDQSETLSTLLGDVDAYGGQSACTSQVDNSDKGAFFVNVTFFRHQGEPLGLEFARDLVFARYEARVTSIATGSQAANSPIRVNHILVSINEKKSEDLDGANLAQLLNDTFGWVKLGFVNPRGDVNLVESMITKSDPKGKVGVSFKKSKNGSLKVDWIHPDSKFKLSLFSGDSVISINGTPVAHLDPKVAKELVQSSPQRITIMAYHPLLGEQKSWCQKEGLSCFCTFFTALAIVGIVFGVVYGTSPE